MFILFCHIHTKKKCTVTLSAPVTVWLESVELLLPLNMTVSTREMDG